MLNSADSLVLHAVRTLGYASSDRIAARLDLDASEVTEHLLDAEAFGWVVQSTYAGDTGWSMTEAGKARGEQLLADELEATQARPTVEQVYQDFLPVNDSVSATCTAWQLRDPAAHEPAVELGQTVEALFEAAAQLAGFEDRLTTHLPRFAGYHRRFSEAASRSTAEPSWITGIDRDSCHRVWFELHENLIATLGITR